MIEIKPTLLLKKKLWGVMSAQREGNGIIPHEISFVGLKTLGTF